MSGWRRRVGWIFLGSVGLAVLAYAATWGWLMTQEDPLEEAVAAWPVWPVVCSWRGCVNTKTWLYYQRQAEAFAAQTEAATVAPETSLTTAARYHLLRQAFVRAPVTEADAKRYRETVLRLADDSALLAETGYGPAEYDKTVLLPFLLQEALRKQYRVESTAELYRLLEEDQALLVLPLQYSWDAAEAAVRR